jgi:hypothetical protein
MTVEQLDAVTDLLQEVLGESLVGAYLHGSSVPGGLRPGGRRRRRCSIRFPGRNVANAMTRGSAGLREDLECDTRNVLLTLVRIWCSLSTGEIRTKDAAAEWALPRLPPPERSAVERAQAVYLGDHEEGTWDVVSARRLAEHLLGEIERVR